MMKNNNNRRGSIVGAVEAWVFMHIIGWKMFGSNHVSHYTFSTLDQLQIDLVH